MYQCLASDWNTKVEKKIQSVIRQVNKYGFSADYKEISREVKEVPFYRVDSGVRVKLGNVLVQVVNYEFNMPDFKVGDYTPVAVIEHDVVVNNVKNMVHLINGFEKAPKEWWTIAGHCDDCNDNYSRKKTVMLLNNETGNFRQIGTSCLKRYLGITCFNVIHNFMLVEELVEEELAMYGDCLPSEKKYVKTADLLGYVYTMYDAMGGYIKNTTIEKAWQAAISPDAAEIPEFAVERVNNTIKFFKNLNNEEELNDFARNVQTAVLTEYTKCSGYIAYAPLLQEKLMAKQTKHEENLSSNYVGNIKDKITVDVTVISCTGFESQYGYMFVNTFQDANKNIFVWITGTKSYDIGIQLKIMGTVKAHNEYNGVKQTVLTRVKEI